MRQLRLRSVHGAILSNTATAFTGLASRRKCVNSGNKGSLSHTQNGTLEHAPHANAGVADDDSSTKSGNYLLSTVFWNRSFGFLPY